MVATYLRKVSDTPCEATSVNYTGTQRERSVKIKQQNFNVVFLRRLVTGNIECKDEFLV